VHKTDIIIDLISSENSKSFRTVYIPKNTTYSIRNIPEGNYTLNIVYGEGYQEKLVNGTCSLSFKNEFLREDSVETLDFNGFKSSKGYSIPNYAMVIDYIKPENSL